VIIGVTETEARRKLIDFTAETIPTRNVVVSYIPHSTVNSVDDLRREQVGVLKGTSWAQAAADAGVSPARIESFDQLDTLLEALKGESWGPPSCLSPISPCREASPRSASRCFPRHIGTPGVGYPERRQGIGQGHECGHREPEENFFGSSGYSVGSRRCKDGSGSISSGGLAPCATTARWSSADHRRCRLSG
jgi:hypothetical protein